MRIEYPVVIDNDYSIWRAFRNHSWPALYLIDPRGRVRHHHFGEGEYDRSEMAIQRLLAEAGAGGRSRRPRVRRWPRGRGGGGLGRLAVPGELSRVRADGALRVARRSRARSASRLCGPCAPGAQSMGAGRRMDDGEGRRPSSAGPAAGSAAAFTRATFISSWGRRAPALHPLPRVARRTAAGSAHGVDVDEAGNGMAVEQRLYQLIRQTRPIASEVRDRVPRYRRGDVRVHVRLVRAALNVNIPNYAAIVTTNNVVDSLSGKEPSS